MAASIEYLPPRGGPPRREPMSVRPAGQPGGAIGLPGRPGGRSAGQPVGRSARRGRRRAVGALAVVALALIALAMSGVSVVPGRDGEAEVPGVRLTDATVLARFPAVAGPGQQSFLAVEPGGDLAISDRLRQLVLRLGPDGRQVGAWGPRLGADYQLGEIGGVAVAGDHWYVLDRAALAVYDLDAAGRVRDRIPLTPLQPYGPNGLAVDAAGTLYVADTGRSRVLVFAPGGRFVRAFGTDGHDLGQLKQPMAIAVAPDGALFVADWENARIERWRPAADGWEATTAWSTGFRPWGVAVDRQGRVYVPDTDRRQVLVYAPDGRALAALGAGAPTIAVDEPTQVAFSPDGARLYVLGADAVAELRVENTAAPPPSPRLPLLPVAVAVALAAAGVILVAVKRAGPRGVGAVGTGAPIDRAGGRGTAP
jgi:sugar lactone lactonase YvrE